MPEVATVAEEPAEEGEMSEKVSRFGVRRVLLVGGGLVTGVAAAQAIQLMVNYKSPPDPEGPRFGLEKYKATTKELQEQGRVIVDGVSERFQNTIKTMSEKKRDTTESVMGVVRKGMDRLHGFIDTEDEPTEEEVKVFSMDNEAAQGAKARRILFIGDSLVQGVGCETGPVMPRQVARVLAETWQVDVSWRALGVTGGDVRLLRREVLPLLKEEVEHVKAERARVAEAEGTPELLSMPAVDTVFIVCGVNDWKSFVKTGRSWRVFRNDLSKLVKDVKEICGDDCRVVLPALPGVEFAPLFQEPLRSIVTKVSGIWDHQKMHIARRLQKVYYVDKPKQQFWGKLKSWDELFAPDRVHPNDRGYSMWAQYLGESVLALGQDQRRGKA